MELLREFSAIRRIQLEIRTLENKTEIESEHPGLFFYRNLTEILCFVQLSFRQFTRRILNDKEIGSKKNY